MGSGQSSSANRDKKGQPAAVTTSATNTPSAFTGTIEVIGIRGSGRRTLTAVLTGSTYDSWTGVEFQVLQTSVDGHLMRLDLFVEKDFKSPLDGLARAQAPRANLVGQILIFDVTYVKPPTEPLCHDIKLEFALFVCLVFGVLSSEASSYEAIKSYLKSTKKIMGVQQLILATKMDVDPKHRTVNLAEAQAVADGCVSSLIDRID